MAEKREVLLDIQVRGGKDAEKNLARLEKGLVEMKNQQAELNKRFKAGELTIDQYAKATSELKFKQSEAAKRTTPIQQEPIECQ